MDSDKEEADVFSDTDAPLREDEEELEELEEGEEKEEDEEEDARIFNAWMLRYRAAEQPSRPEDEEVDEVVEVESPARRRADRRASLPCPATLSSMQLSRLHSSTKTPVTARVLLHRNSSRSLLLSPQQVVAPASAERRPSLIPTIPEVTAPERRGQFRRRNVMSLSDADSICLICHHELREGGGARELQCSHTFHRECIEEWLWRKPSCPTCHVQVSPPPSSSLTSTRVRVP